MIDSQALGALLILLTIYSLVALVLEIRGNGRKAEP